MIELLPVQDKSIQKEYCSRCSVEYDPDMLIYAALYNGTMIAMCQIELKNSFAKILNISCLAKNDRSQIIFLLLSAVVNFLELCSISRVEISSSKSYEKTIYLLGFRKKLSGVYEMNFN